MASKTSTEQGGSSNYIWITKTYTVITTRWLYVNNINGKWSVNFLRVYKLK